MKNIVKNLLIAVSLTAIGAVMAAILLEWVEVAIPSAGVVVATIILMTILDKEWQRNVPHQRTVEVGINYFRERKEATAQLLHMHSYPLKRLGIE